MKSSKYIFINLLGFLILGSCANNNDQYNNLQTVKVTAEAHAKEKEVVSSFGDTITTPPYDITVDMDFVDSTSVENAEVCRSINRQLIESFLELKNMSNGQQAVDQFIKDKEKECEEDNMAEEIEVHYTGRIEYGRDGVINYTWVEDFDGGGAHPSVDTSILRFDTNTGERIDLYGFFADTCSNTLRDKLTKRLMKDVNVPSLDSLHAIGYLNDQDMFISKNFLLKKDSVTFFYNPYDIAPYSEGCTKISLSYDELKGCIKRQ